MAMTENGISTCTGLGQEKYETFYMRVSRRKSVKKVQYDYRSTEGILFSCVRNTLEECRTARDKEFNDRGIKL